MVRPADSNISPITMDSRKFLGAINSSLQSKIVAMEHCVRELGNRAGASWKLVVLNPKNLFIEDTDNHTYYVADYDRREKGGNVSIQNVRPIRIVESRKRTLFEASCKQLVDAVETNDQRAMNTAFNKMAGQRFSSRTVPFSGTVRTHDNITRTVPLASECVVDESIRPRLVAAIVDGLTSKVTIREGIPVNGRFVNRKLRLPVSEWLCRKAVARQMRRVAEDAYWSPGFQDRVCDVAKLVYEDKIENAVTLVSEFLTENQEFTLLNRSQSKRLIENALATKAVFNQRLCEDTANLFWRTNLKVNRATIIKEWRTTARRASHPTLLENVSLLEQSTNFEAAYDKFIGLVFNEAAGPRDVQVSAYKTALEALKGTPKIKESNELSGKIDELIERLAQPESDHAVIAEVEDLLAEVKNEMNALDTLDDYDDMPGGAPNEEEGSALGDQEEEPATKSGTTVNFNINISSDGVETNTGGEEEGGDELDELLGGGGEEEEGGEEGGDELEDLLGGGGEEEEGGGDDDLAKLLGGGESRGRDREPISEIDDPYQYNRKGKAGNVGADYGTKPISIAEDCYKAVQAMFRIAEHNSLAGGQLIEQATNLATAGLKATGLMIPERRLGQAVEQLCDAFFDELDRQGIELDEDQYKGPWRHVWSRKKAAINARERKKDTKSESRNQTRKPIREMGNAERPGRAGREGSETQHNGGKPPGRHMSDPKAEHRFVGHEVPPKGKLPSKLKKGPPKVEWVEEEDNAKKGYFGGVGFIFDHANGQDEPIILSEDGAVEVPIPRSLHDSAYAAANMSNGDPRPFLQWLTENIEQFRPLSEDGDLDDSINEAVLKVRTNPDGGIEIEVDSNDPDVMLNEPPVDGELELPPEEGDELDVAPGMEPVDPMVPPDMGGEGGELEGEMPDFEGMEGGEEEEGGEEIEAGTEEEEEGAEEVEAGAEEEEEGVAEDRDITNPQTTKYNTTKQDHRQQPKVPKAGKAGEQLDGISTGNDKPTPGVKMKKVKASKGKKGK